MKKSWIKRSSKPMSKVSKKRRAEQKIYSEQRKIFLLQNPVCQIKSSECTWNATMVHHGRGRQGIRYLNQDEWFASCWCCNQFIETAEGNLWARERGFKLDRLGNL